MSSTPDPLTGRSDRNTGHNPYSVSVAGIVVDDAGRVLLVRRRENGQWEPPGGVLEGGETIAEGLRREVREETGLEVDVGALTGVYQNLRNNVIALALRCVPTGGEAVTGDETTGFLWASPEDVSALTTEVFAARVLDGLEPAPSAPALRLHDGVHLL